MLLFTKATTHATDCCTCSLGYQPHAFVLLKKSYDFREGSPRTDDFHYHALVYIEFAHSCTVYVGLAQARPN